MAIANGTLMGSGSSGSSGIGIELQRGDQETALDLITSLLVGTCWILCFSSILLLLPFVLVLPTRPILAIVRVRVRMCLRGETKPKGVFHWFWLWFVVVVVVGLGLLIDDDIYVTFSCTLLLTIEP